MMDRAFTSQLLALIIGAACAAAAGEFDPLYYAKDWPDVCAEGMSQSPIDIRTGATSPAPASWATYADLPTVDDRVARNTGHGLEMSWGSVAAGTGDIIVQVAGDSLNDIFSADADQPTRPMKFSPLQLHFHDPSEHTVDGLYFPAEMHVVSAVAEGEAPEWGCDEFWQTGDSSDIVNDRCIAVFGVLFKIGDETPDFILDMLDNAPLAAGETAPLNGTLDLATVLPTQAGYYTYPGSLTTPPCSEGLRWHVFNTPLTITEEDMDRMYQVVADTFDPGAPENVNGYRATNRVLQPLNGRKVLAVNIAGSPA